MHIFTEAFQTLTVSDRYYSCNCNSGGEPTPDQDFGGEDNIISFSGMQFLSANGSQVTLVQFQRNLVTSDTVADNPIVAGNMTYVYQILLKLC